MRAVVVRFNPFFRGKDVEYFCSDFTGVYISLDNSFNTEQLKKNLFLVY